MVYQKITKVSETRGSSSNSIYQNRVSRNGTVLVRYEQWRKNSKLRKQAKEGFFETGIVVMIPPKEYFKDTSRISSLGLELGKNALVLYESQNDLDLYPPEENGLNQATKRFDGESMGGEYLSWVIGTKEKVLPTGNLLKGIGIPLYEYAPRDQMSDATLQLEVLYWLCPDSVEVTAAESNIDVAQVKKDRKSVV